MMYDTKNWLKHKYKEKYEKNINSSYIPASKKLFEKIDIVEDDGMLHCYRNYIHRQRDTGICKCYYFDNGELYYESEINQELYYQLLAESEELNG